MRLLRRCPRSVSEDFARPDGLPRSSATDSPSRETARGFARSSSSTSPRRSGSSGRGWRPDLGRSGDPRVRGRKNGRPACRGQELPTGAVHRRHKGGQDRHGTGAPKPAADSGRGRERPGGPRGFGRPPLLARPARSRPAWIVVALPDGETRIAYAVWLRRQGLETWLCHLLFTDDPLHHPTSRAEWVQALATADRQLGIHDTEIPFAGHAFLRARSIRRTISPTSARSETQHLDTNVCSPRLGR